MARVSDRSACDLVEQVRQMGVRLGLWRRGMDYSRACRQLFSGIDLHGKRVLEIGCGKGLFCLWAKIQGAEQVVGLEPLAEGSFDSMQCHDQFRSMVSVLGLNGIEMLPCTIQEYECPDGYFDIVLSVASINHLDEPSCVHLRHSAEARESYRSIFGQLRTLMKPDGMLVVVDGSNRNLFGDLGLRNPFAPDIEWFKHHPAEDWAELLLECGFVDPHITWPSGRLLRHLGIQTLGKTLSYFVSSIFRLTTRCQKPGVLVGGPDQLDRPLEYVG